MRSGMLPVVLPRDQVLELLDDAEQRLELEIDLAAQQVIRHDGSSFSFEVDAFRKHCLLNGFDDIGLTMEKMDAIRGFEASAQPTSLNVLLLLTVRFVCPSRRCALSTSRGWTARRRVCRSSSRCRRPTCPRTRRATTSRRRRRSSGAPRSSPDISSGSSRRSTREHAAVEWKGVCASLLHSPTPLLSGLRLLCAFTCAARLREPLSANGLKSDDSTDYM